MTKSRDAMSFGSKNVAFLGLPNMPRIYPLAICPLDLLAFELFELAESGKLSVDNCKRARKECCRQSSAHSISEKSPSTQCLPLLRVSDILIMFLTILIAIMGSCAQLLFSALNELL